MPHAPRCATNTAWGKGSPDSFCATKDLDPVHPEDQLPALHALAYRSVRVFLVRVVEGQIAGHERRVHLDILAHRFVGVVGVDEGECERSALELRPGLVRPLAHHVDPLAYP